MNLLFMILMKKAYLSKHKIKNVKFKDDCNLTHFQSDDLEKKMAKCNLKNTKNTINEIRIINPNNEIEKIVVLNNKPNN